MKNDHTSFGHDNDSVLDLQHYGGHGLGSYDGFHGGHTKLDLHQHQPEAQHSWSVGAEAGKHDHHGAHGVEKETKPGETLEHTRQVKFHNSSNDNGGV